LSEGCRLYRIRSEAIVCGVCAGLAKYFGIDVSIVRLLTVAVMLLNPLFVLLYIAACIIVPEAPRPEDAKRCMDLSYLSHGRAVDILLLVLGIVLVVGGACVATYGPAWIWKPLWMLQGVLLIVAGLVLLIAVLTKVVRRSEI